jgi:hypothetical protein
MWKPLNYQVLMQSRHDDPRVRASGGGVALWTDWSQVRVNALAAVREMYTRLGEELLVLLPETVRVMLTVGRKPVSDGGQVPFLAELLEDADERVEHACRDTIKTIETFLGESLQQYLQ